MDGGEEVRGMSRAEKEKYVAHVDARGQRTGQGSAGDVDSGGGRLGERPMLSAECSTIQWTRQRKRHALPTIPRQEGGGR